MTRGELREALSGIPSWDNACEEAKDAFASEMAAKRYGVGPCQNAWHWYYDGWCAHVDYAIREGTA